MIDEHQKFQRLAERLWPGAKLLRTWSLTGGTSTQVMGLEASVDDGHLRRAVVRCYGEADLKRNPQAAAHEYQLLKALRSAGFASPAPYDHDESTAILPAPYVVIEYIEGQPEFNPPNLDVFIRKLAEHLSKLHTLQLQTANLSFLPSQQSTVTEKLSRRSSHMEVSRDERRIHQVLEPI